eukprot:9887226-Prorocentrum_lima.AAC.1
MTSSLVGSEMCIRDSRSTTAPRVSGGSPRRGRLPRSTTVPGVGAGGPRVRTCLLYTSDAADDMQ